MRIEVSYSNHARLFFVSLVGVDSDSAAAIGLNTTCAWATRRGAENSGKWILESWRKDAERKLSEAQQSGKWTLATALENFLMLSADMPVVHL